MLYQLSYTPSVPDKVLSASRNLGGVNLARAAHMPDPIRYFKHISRLFAVRCERFLE